MTEVAGLASGVLRTLARLAPGRPAAAEAVIDLRAAGARAAWLGWDDECWAGGAVLAGSAGGAAFAGSAGGAAFAGSAGGAVLAGSAGGTDPQAKLASLPGGPVSLPPRPELATLAAVDQIHREDRLLRAGWMVVSGPAVVSGRRAEVCTPLASWPVRLSQRGDSIELDLAGDVDVTALVADRARGEQLAERLQESMARWPQWVHEVTGAAGLGQPPVARSGNPLEPTDRLIAFAGLVIFVARPAEPVAVSPGLAAWADRPGIERTALAAVYGIAEDGAAARPPDPNGNAAERPVSPLPLTAAQARTVVSARSAPVTVVSGPPGCGKTHTLAAIALDAIAQGRSVLLATRSRHAAEVIGGMLHRANGPVPILFGDTELRRAIADELAQGLPMPLPSRELTRRQRELADAVATRRRIEHAAATVLATEAAAARVQQDADLLPVWRAAAPALFTGSNTGETDLHEAHRALESAAAPRRGLFVRWRTGRARRRLDRLTGATPDVSLDEIAEALAAADDLRVALRLEREGGTSTTRLRDRLLAADAAVEAAAASWIDGVASSGRSRGGAARRAVADLAGALRAGRATRRRLLEGIAGHDLTRALPLWVGTLGDVENLLPPVPGLFDLVVVDEASHVDQPLAAPALVRAGRAVIAGDPRQLRHVSFVSGDQVRQAVAAEGTGRLSGLLDVPRMSLLDVAVGASPAHWLDEHYRCAPHLISFATSRFYAGRIALLTTHPSIADLDCIHVWHVTGTRNAEGVNEAEVAAVVEHARRLIAEGATSVGLLSPFRAQADAIEKAALAELSLEQITSGGLRVGTVHSFQGSECDELVVSLALSDRDPAASWRFLNDPNLVTVLTTRARRTVALFTSAAQPTGLIAEYIAHGESPPSETTGTPTNDVWGAELATELRRAGHEVRTGYPVGHWSVDLVVGGGERAIALETRVHQEGVPAHLARWRTLTAAGWRAYDAYPTRFGRDSTTAVIQLGTELEESAHDQAAHDQAAHDQAAHDQTANDEPALDETARA